jgi:hypothetical protein
MYVQIEKCLMSLNKRHINGIYAMNSREAAHKIMDIIPDNAIIGMGDSSTVRQIGLLEHMKDRVLTVLNPFEEKELHIDPKDAHEYTNATSRKAAICDVFIAGTNAVTQDGRIVNVDAVGNRVAGMFWGHPISIIIVGKNKIVKTLDEAFDRIRNTIAPNHSLIKTAASGGKPKTPCAVNGECTDCRSVERKCNIFTIIESKPLQTNLNVVVVNEDLGLGWDPSWPEDRINKIRERHIQYSWKPAFEIRHQAT